MSEIKVFHIGSSIPHPHALREWLDELGVKETDIEGMEGVPASELLIAVAAKRCYNSFSIGLNPNVSRKRDDFAAYFDNILSSGHGSVLEHVTFNFAIEGITRVGTAELNRHRAGVAISEGSMRYIRLDRGINYWEPHSIADRVDDDTCTMMKKARTREIFRAIFGNVEAAYHELCELWDVDELPMAEKKKLTSMFRRIVPMGVQTGGVWTFNIRSLRHILALRGTEHAEEEIQYIARTMCYRLRESHPWLFGDFNDNAVPKYPKV